MVTGEPSIRLKDIVDSLGGQLFGDSARAIESIASLEAAGPDAISFLDNPRYASQLATTLAACIIVSPAFQEKAIARGDCIVVPNPYLYYARLTQWWKMRKIQGKVPPGVHPSAIVSTTALIDPSASIGPLCVVGDHVHIGAQSVLAAHVTVNSGCQIGKRCLIHPGAVIGADGFGFAPDNNSAEFRWEKIEQMGAVRIGDDVEIGANTCIDRGALSDTVIEDGVKLDNLIQIGHNVVVGRHTAMAACVAVAGSARIGAFCTIGGASNIAGHITLADYVHISGATVVMKSIHEKGTYTGIFPLDAHRQWEKNAAALRGLSSLRSRVISIENNQNKD
jgi:UDP-3-O-[3-hydroxymyristoyl] glucosamine N-acyltransferase